MAKQKLKKVFITQVKSTISQTQRQKRTITALGLGKIDRTVEKELSPQVEGMIKKVNHLIKVKEIVKWNYIL
mgnify:CR=1 FL=1